ncbi:co-chaperone YbbN [Geobacter sp.]|uniref:thioredoxin family protein n=1 Tax=Geobacter sp. TaxID=46610 RepID=UPI0027BA4DE4|nr:thioredoxin family protein [Geobacter sp.]
MRFLAALFLVLTATVSRAELPSASDAAINQTLAAGKPAVIDLGARSCIPCKKMAPILESLVTQYRGKAGILFIDVHENKTAAKRFRVQLIPTQIFFDARGKEVKRHMGFMDKADIVKELSALGVR